MAFTKLTKALDVPIEATASYSFYALPGVPALVCRHAGDGTPAYKTASWNVANARRARGIPKRLSQEVTEEFALAHAKLVADHCVIGWSGMDAVSDTPSPACTPETVLEFLTAIIRADDGLAVYGEFRTWIADADTFRPTPAPAPDLAELGKR